jgi:hypothetical protein
MLAAEPTSTFKVLCIAKKTRGIFPGEDEAGRSGVQE